jgi:TPR repeat protein
MIRFCFAAAAAVMLATAAVAAPIDDAKKAFSIGDFGNAESLLEPLAAAGNPEAQLFLGFIYINGRSSTGSIQDGVQLHRALAEKGYAQAQYSLGVVYQRGRGVDADDDEAAKWYRSAAEQGHALAQFSLGVMYTNNRGVPADDVQAYFWIALAVKGTEPGETQDSLNRNLDAVRDHMKPEQRVEAERLIAAWKPKDGPRMLDRP